MDDERSSLAPLIVCTVAVVGVIWALLVLCIRLYLRLKLNGPIGRDDFAVIVATALGTAQSACILASVRHGLGSLSAEHSSDYREGPAKLGYAAAVLYVLATFASRASSCLLYARLTRTKFHIDTAHIGLGMSVLSGVVGALVVILQCKVPRVWDTLNSTRCLDTYALWLGVEIAGVVVELFIFAISLVLVWTLHMKTKMKAIVVGAFSVRLLVIIPLGLRLKYIHDATSASRSMYTSISVTILTIITMQLAIMATTLPCLKQFLAMFDSGLIGDLGDSTYHGNSTTDSTRRKTSTFNSYALKSIARRSAVQGGRSDGLHLSPDDGDMTVEIGADDGASVRTNASGKAIIRKTQAWEVTYER